MDDVRFPIPPSPTKFMDQLRAFIRLDGKSYATEQVYLYWIRQFILFHKRSIRQKCMRKMYVNIFLF